jgi:prepilin-type N-terminal cleavage/methylation domain-containing protein
MKQGRSISDCPKGFTLVEIIVTLVAAGILGAIFIHFMGTALDSSWNSVAIVRGEGNGEGIMEQIVADYVERMNTDPDNALSQIVAAWNGQSFADGEVAVTTEYIQFDAGGDEVAPPPVSSNTLKVTIVATGNNMVAILTSISDAGDLLTVF